jgi:hypothetical protein
MTTRDDSVFIICVTASRHFSSGSEPIQRLSKRCFATATRRLNRWVLPKWQRERALALHPFEVEDWLKQIERKQRLETSTLAEIS